MTHVFPEINRTIFICYQTLKRVDDRQYKEKWTKILKLIAFLIYLHNFHYILKTVNVYYP